MRMALLIAAKDLRQRLRDRSIILFAVVAPLGLALIFSMLLRGATSFHANYVVADLDGGSLATTFTGQVLGGLRDAGVATIETRATEADARQAVAAADTEGLEGGRRVHRPARLLRGDRRRPAHVHPDPRGEGRRPPDGGRPLGRRQVRGRRHERPARDAHARGAARGAAGRRGPGGYRGLRPAARHRARGHRRPSSDSSPGRRTSRPRWRSCSCSSPSSPGCSACSRSAGRGRSRAFLLDPSGPGRSWRARRSGAS